MIEIAYTSRASKMFSPQELQDLHQEAMSFNREHEVTGLLLYNDGIFFQVIEGEAEVVLALYASICKDFRHYDVRTIYEQPLAARNFKTWAMSFHNISHDQRQPIHSQIDISDLDNMDAWIAPSTAQVLVNAFRLL